MNLKAVTLIPCSEGEDVQVLSPMYRGACGVDALNEGLRASRGMGPEYDGVAEVWFESEQDLMEAMSSPEMEALGAALFEDESNFIDHARSCAFIVEEHELAAPTAATEETSG